MLKTGRSPLAVGKVHASVSFEEPTALMLNINYPLACFVLSLFLVRNSTSAIIHQGEDFDVYQSVSAVLSSDGTETLKTNRFTLLENSLNYLENSVWRKSQDLIEPFPGGAVARKGPTSAIFSADLADEVTFDVQASDGTRVRGKVLSIQARDLISGQTVVLATLKQAGAGELHPPNKVVYPNAFTGLRADIVYIWKHSSFCQEIVFLQQPVLPIGMTSESARLEVVTEFFAPEPKIRSRIVTRIDGQNETDDAVIRFGKLMMIEGKAYPVADGSRIEWGSRSIEGTPVLKRWTVAEGRQFLYESVPWRELENALKTLPLVHSDPAPQSQPQDKRRPIEDVPGQKRDAMLLAKANYAPVGYLIDFVIVPGASPSTFESNETYYIRDEYDPNFSLNFQANCFIKYKENASIQLHSAGWGFPATGKPPVLTSRNDDLFGAKIVGVSGEVDSDGDPMKHRAAEALAVQSIPENDAMYNIKFRWAKKAITYVNSVGTLRDSVIEHSDYGIFADDLSSVWLERIKGCGVTNLITGDGVSGTITIDCGVINVTKRDGIEAEASIAVNPQNTNTIVAFSVYLNPHPEGLIRSRSYDGGATWTTDQIATGADYTQACCDPSAVFDQYGNLFLAYMNGNKNTAILLQSTNQGTNFNQIYSYQGPAGAYNDQFAPAVDQPTVTTGPGQGGTNGSVWLTFAEWRTNVWRYHIRVSGAPVTNQGVGSFTTFNPISGTNDAVFSDISVGQTGQVMVAYQDKEVQKLYSSLDSDGLGTGGFSSPAEVVATKMEWSLKIPAQNKRGVEVSTGVAYDKSQGPYRGRVYFLYTDRLTNNTPDTDIYVKYSTNNGANWTGSVKVNDNTNTTSQFMPWMAVDQSSGKLAVSWYDCRNDPTDNRRPLFYAAVSTTGGTNFSKNIQINPAASDMQIIWTNNTSYAFDYGDYTSLAFVGGYLYPAWADNSNNPTNYNGKLKLEVHTAKFPF